MKHASDILLKGLAVALIAILALLPFHAFLSTWGGTTIGPLVVWKAWKEMLLVGLLVLAIVYCALRPAVAKVLAKRWVNWLVVVYALLHGWWAVQSQASPEAVQAGLLFNLRFLAIFLLAQVVVASGHPWVHRIRQIVGPLILSLTVIIAVLAIVQVTLLPPDFLAQFGYNKDTTIAPYILIDQTPEALRAFATLRGPNDLGAYLLLPLALAVSLVFADRRNVLSGLALGLGLAALVATWSRSAWLGAAAATVALGVLWIPRPKLIKAVRIAILPAFMALGLFLWAAATVPALRLAVFHSSPGESLLEGSSEQHWHSTANGVANVIANPWGQGVGTAGPASFYNQNQPAKLAENYFVQVAQEVGWLGLVLFVAISAGTGWYLWRQRSGLWPKVLLASFVGINVINLWLHGWADDPLALTWWAFAGLYVFDPPKKGKL